MVLASHNFAGLVEMQAKARKLEARLAIFEHPIAGLGPKQLETRVEQAWQALQEKMQKG